MEDFIKEVAAMTDDMLVETTEDELYWMSQYPNDEIRVGRVDACKAEASRRCKPQLYETAFSEACRKSA